MALRVSLEPREQQVLPVPPAGLDQSVRLVGRVPRALQALQVRQVHLVHRAIRVPLDGTDRKDQQARQVQQDPQDQPDQPAGQVRLVQRANPVYGVLLAPRDQQARLGLPVRLVPLAGSENQATRAHKVGLDHLATRVSKDLPDQQDQLVPQHLGAKRLAF